MQERTAQDIANKKKLDRLMKVDDQLNAIRTLTSDFKTMNASRSKLSTELRALRIDLQEEYQQLTTDLTGWVEA